MSSKIRRRLAAGVVLTMAVGLLAPAAAEEQESDPDPRLPTRPYGLRQLRYDARYLVHRPFRLERRGKAKLLAVAGTTLALYLAREEIRDFVDDHRCDGATRLANRARDVFGKGAFAPTLALIAYSASFATHDEREKETAFLLLESMAYSSLVAASGSFVLAAERPESGDSIHFFDSDGRGISLDVALAASVVPRGVGFSVSLQPGHRTRQP
ncbi:MAG: hypothetical protein GY856_00260 [bacterium]|nr:hypothetical protein [bacterium]